MNYIFYRREAMIKSLIESYDAYEDLLEKSQQGTRFYQNLEEGVKRLHTRIRNICKTQEEERQQVIKRMMPKGLV